MRFNSSYGLLFCVVQLHAANNKSLRFKATNSCKDVDGNVQNPGMKPPAVIPRFQPKGLRSKGKLFKTLSEQAIDILAKFDRQTEGADWTKFVKRELNSIVTQKAWGLSPFNDVYLKDAYFTQMSCQDGYDAFVEIVKDEIEKKMQWYMSKEQRDRDLMDRFRRQGFFDEPIENVSESSRREKSKPKRKKSSQVGSSDECSENPVSLAPCFRKDILELLPDSQQQIIIQKGGRKKKRSSELITLRKKYTAQKKETFKKVLEIKNARLKSNLANIKNSDKSKKEQRSIVVSYKKALKSKHNAYKKQFPASTKIKSVPALKDLIVKLMKPSF